MKERPILFNAEMVRAILDGRKTQTRRPVKPQPPADIDSLHHGKLASLAPYKLLDDDYNPQGFGFEDGRGQFWKSPFGTVGDRLWVRETFYWEEGSDKTIEQVAHRASTEMPPEVKAMGCRWTPSIHMPRWASRIDIEITRVWVERVQDITEHDASREGVQLLKPEEQTYYGQFHRIWQSIYGTWDANPWVWAYEFRRVKP